MKSIRALTRKLVAGKATSLIAADANASDTPHARCSTLGAH